ncbi:MAG: hypothetical protein WBC06_15315 [Chitinophagaceae bacterium]
MGYELHITRKANWFDEDDSRQISFDEWTQILVDDKEMRLDGFAEVATTNGDTIKVESEGLSIWTKYSGNGLNGNYAWFDYSLGRIVCKNPDDEIISKMLDIAKRLNAKVQGDEGEIYERSDDNKISYRHIIENNNKQTDNKKPWWKFW